MKQHHITRLDGYALGFGGRLDVLAVECRAGVQHGLAEVFRHVQQHAAADDGRQAVDAELGDSGDSDEVCRAIAVVVDVIDAHVAEPVDLAADAHPDVHQIVVAGGLVGAHGGAATVVQLQDGHGIRSRRISWGRWPGFHAKTIGFACGHQFRRGDDLLRGQVVDCPQGVVGPVL